MDRRKSRGKSRKSAKRTGRVPGVVTLPRASGAPPKPLHASREVVGGFFWNKRRNAGSLAEKEAKAYEEIRSHALVYMAAAWSPDVIDARTRLGAKKTPGYVKYIKRSDDAGVADKLYFRNKGRDTAVCYTSKLNLRSAAAMKNHFKYLNNNELSQNPVNSFLDYLLSRPGDFDTCVLATDSKWLFEDTLMIEIIEKSLLFRGVDDFKKSISEFEGLGYDRRAHIYCLLADFFTQKYVRSTALFNAETTTYYRHLMDDYGIKGKQLTDNDTKNAVIRKLDRFASTMRDAEDGGVARRVDNALRNTPGTSSSVPTFTSLPPKMYGGAAAPAATASTDLKFLDFVHITELFLNEQTVASAKALDPTRRAFQFKMYEPLSVGSLGNTTNNELLFTEDLHCKMLVSIRQCRKYVILHEYYKIMVDHSYSFSDLENMQVRYDNRPDDEKVEAIFDRLVSTVVADIDTKVVRNFDSVSAALRGKPGKNVGPSTYVSSPYAYSGTGTPYSNTVSPLSRGYSPSIPSINSSWLNN